MREGRNGSRCQLQCQVWERSQASSQKRSQGEPGLDLSLALAERPRTALLPCGGGACAAQVLRRPAPEGAQNTASVSLPAGEDGGKWTHKPRL